MAPAPTAETLAHYTEPGWPNLGDDIDTLRRVIERDVWPQHDFTSIRDGERHEAALGPRHPGRASALLALERLATWAREAPRTGFSIP